MVELNGQKEKVKTVAVSNPNENNSINEGNTMGTSTESCSTEQRENKNQKRSLEESLGSNVATSKSNDDGDSNSQPQPTTDTVPPLKKQRTDERDKRPQDSEKKESEDDELMVDVCEAIGLKANTRIEVKWDLIMEESNALETETRWWGAKLLPHDGRMHTLSEVDGLGDDTVTVPLRVLDYDPYVAGGFTERSTAEVAFLNNHLLFEIATETHLSFRAEGSDWEVDENAEADDDTVISASSDGGKEEGLRSMIEAILQSAFVASGCSNKMETLSAAQQCFMAEKIRVTKESLINKMMKRINEEDAGVITADCVKQCMQEMGNELRSW
mmetsp:Transcript_40040/g.48800  ORF Transcript_40040/g.48800 Transcript_40040/m.48800 type:complete len:328 (+) Transcript_40040:181-1164(+)|eukprot:CAMPEP_0172504638 /NCGR_PEP_ID=MMETSP1066-20121228/180437_1 /TAXON_ID=671091 /ORGANISM="Coscinodiscus wailesii, Strain CCMP2513" /LENGTH=327 /DNA_ID=CAMNT_0013280913 /DNA_START=170 /DNA_END=1153 /DNA_ORIENTATION=-